MGSDYHRDQFQYTLSRMRETTDSERRSNEKPLEPRDSILLVLMDVLLIQVIQVILLLR